LTQPIIRIVTLAGDANLDESCKGGDFSDPYDTWNNVIIEASIIITLRDYYAPVKTKTNHITSVQEFSAHCQKTNVTMKMGRDNTFTLSKKSEYNVCGYTLVQTEHPKLLIVETNKNNLITKLTRISVNNLDIFTYINSKFIYVEKHLKIQMQDFYHNILDQKCRLEQQVLKNVISLAHDQLDAFVYNLMKGSGYMSGLCQAK
ncbi:hypothetical protein ALC56_09141, partial [Trachymyrmex septentrionalis]